MKHFFLYLACGMAALGASVGPETSLTVLPESAALTTPESRQQFLAEATADGYQQDWTKTAQWS